MDILNPDTVWIENRCYRVLNIRVGSKDNIEEEYEPTPSTYVEDEYEDPNIPIIHQGNRFFTTLHVPGSLLGLVKGKNGNMQKSLEQKFSSTIKIPPQKNPEAGISIFGYSKSSVSLTYSRIKELVNTARLREDFTHFVSLPINSPEIQESYERFKEEVLAKYNKTKGIDASLFQKPCKLHVTIAPLVLLDERDKHHAEVILKDCIETVMKDFDDKVFAVQVKGIEYMNDDPAEVDVLYGKVQQAGDTSLQIIADMIMQAFVKEKLCKDQHEKVKLHVTLMNTRFRDSPETNDDKTRKRITFDARPIQKEFDDYDFGQITISEIHLSVRHTQSSSDGYYLASCKVKLK